MTEQEIVKKAMDVRGFTQKMLADQAGLARQSNVSEMLRGSSLRVDNLFKLLDAMGFDIIVKDRNSNNRQNVWKIQR